MLNTNRLPTDNAEKALLFICGLIGLHDIFILLIGLNNPLVDIHSFRQTQTALTSYWMLQGGPLFAYETPVIGAPWAVPFEFPIYQWFTVILASIGVPLDAAGRFTSFVFFFACLWPLHMLYKRLNFGSYAYLTTVALFLASPIYIYWGRTFMIETSALFFALLWLALFIEYVNRPGWALFVGTLCIGIVGILNKSTTYPAFAFLGGLYFLYAFYQEWMPEKKITSVSKWILLIALLILPFIPAVLWVAFTDVLKMENPIGPKLTSTALISSKWNFGTLDQRLSLHLWYKVIFKRTLSDIFGTSVYLGYAFLLALLISCRLRAFFATLFLEPFKWYIWATLFTFFLPFMIFTKLHMVHNYYQTANALFLIATVGLVLGMVAKAGHKTIITILVAVIVIGQLVFFHRNYYSQVTKTSMSWMRIAQTAKSMTPSDSSLIVIGIDWSSLVAYYSQRKSLTLPGWISNELIDRIIADPQQFLGKRKFSGIVVCKSRVAKRIIKRMKPLLDKRKVVAHNANCQFYQ